MGDGGRKVRNRKQDILTSLDMYRERFISLNEGCLGVLEVELEVILRDTYSNCYTSSCLCRYPTVERSLRAAAGLSPLCPSSLFLWV